MKPNAQTRSTVLTRSLLALSLGCVLANLPLSVATAQDSSSTTSRTTGPVDASKPASERPKLSGDEQKFMKTAGAGNTAEIKLAELALKNGESAGVKEFAHKMITDHTQANKDLEAVAQREQITDFAPEPTAEDKAIYEKMEGLKGKAFDEAYIKNAVEDHNKDLSDYKGAHNNVTSKDLLAYVNKVEAIIQEHLHMAKKLEKTETKS